MSAGGITLGSSQSALHQNTEDICRRPPENIGWRQNEPSKENGDPGKVRLSGLLNYLQPIKHQLLTLKVSLNIGPGIT